MDIESMPLGEVRLIENVINSLNLALSYNVHHEMMCDADEHEHPTEAEFDHDLSGPELGAFLIWEEEALDLISKVRVGLEARGQLIPETLENIDRKSTTEMEADDRYPWYGDQAPG